MLHIDNWSPCVSITGRCFPISLPFKKVPFKLRSLQYTRGVDAVSNWTTYILKWNPLIELSWYTWSLYELIMWVWWAYYCKTTSFQPNLPLRVSTNSYPILNANFNNYLFWVSNGHELIKMKFYYLCLWTTRYQPKHQQFYLKKPDPFVKSASYFEQLKYIIFFYTYILSTCLIWAHFLGRISVNVCVDVSHW